MIKYICWLKDQMLPCGRGATSCFHVVDFISLVFFYLKIFDWLTFALILFCLNYWLNSYKLLVCKVNAILFKVYDNRLLLQSQFQYSLCVNPKFLQKCDPTLSTGIWTSTFAKGCNANQKLELWEETPNPCICVFLWICGLNLNFSQISLLKSHK